MVCQPGARRATVLPYDPPRKRSCTGGKITQSQTNPRKAYSFSTKRCHQAAPGQNGTTNAILQLQCLACSSTLPINEKGGLHHDVLGHTCVKALTPAQEGV
jgi:hypothetical protein